MKTKKRQTQGGWFATVQFVRKPVAQCFTCCRRHAWVGLPAAARCCQWWENVATAKWKDFLPHSIIFMDNSFLTIKLNIANNKTGAQPNIDHRGNLWQAWESQHMNITKKTQLSRIKWKLSRLSRSRKQAEKSSIRTVVFIANLRMVVGVILATKRKLI